MQQVIRKMDKRSLDWLYDYVETSHFSTELFEVVENYQTNHDVLYRGIMYPIAKLKVGNVYEHDYLITSWTTKKEFAVDIATNKDLPEWAYEDAYYWKHGVGKEYFSITKEECIDLAKLFCPIVLVGRKISGVEVNTHIPEHDWNKEEEVVVYKGKWEIVNVKECMVEEKRYYEVKVQGI